jgi:VIT1/CCC1 family predicted Fe2+/Mn2+ transporter
VPAKKTKEVIEMFGEFLREAAVLVPVFFLLEYALKYDGKLTFSFVLSVLSLSLLLLTLGIICEKLR